MALPHGMNTNGFGRLKNVLDNNSKVTGSYRYNYGSEPYLTISLHSKSFSYTGGTEYVVVKSNLAWTASSNQTWLTVSPTSGTYNDTLTVICSQN